MAGATFALVGIVAVAIIFFLLVWGAAKYEQKLAAQAPE
jgi:hypothetical protein